MKLVASCALAQSKWGGCNRKDLLPAAARLRTVAIRQTMRDFGIGGEHCVGQFAFGFPITGGLSQKSLYPVGDNADRRISTSRLYVSAGSRFRERAAKSGHKNAQLLRDDAMGQAQKGWLLPPAELAPDGRPRLWRSGEFNIAFRLGVLQQDKLPACDDLEQWMANLA